MRPLSCLTLVVALASASGEAIAQEVLQVGDIGHNPLLDDPSFVVCNDRQVAQYYNFGADMAYRSEKPTLRKAIDEAFDPTLVKGITGYLTIRFIINCEGKAGRFRAEGMTMSYQPMKFNQTLVARLTDVLKEYKLWGVASYNGVQYDYYHYLTFKIENGELKEVLP